MITARLSPSWLTFSLLVVAVAILALFDAYCRPQVVTVTQATVTPTLVIQVIDTRPPLLPPTWTPTSLPTETPFPTALPSATPRPAPTETSTATPRPVTPTAGVQRG